MQEIQNRHAKKNHAVTLFPLSSNLNRMDSPILAMIFSVNCNFLNTRFSLQILTAPGVMSNF